MIHERANLLMRIISSAPVSELSPTIKDCILHQNYPNPFNPKTTISFRAPQSSEVELGVYNSNGQLVKTLFSGRVQNELQLVNWNGRDFHGAEVASGVYIYRLKSSNFATQKKFLLLK